MITDISHRPISQRRTTNSKVPAVSAIVSSQNHVLAVLDASNFGVSLNMDNHLSPRRCRHCMPFTYASSRLPISGSLLLAISRIVLQVAFHNQIQETLQVPRHGANNVFLVKERAGILAFDSDAGSTSVFSPSRLTSHKREAGLLQRKRIEFVLSVSQGAIRVLTGAICVPMCRCTCASTEPPVQFETR